MSSIKRLIAALLVGGAGFALFVACGPVNNGAGACTFDADCLDTEACEGGTCVPTCESDADCLDGEVCEEGQNTDKLVCQASGGTNGGTNGTTNGSTNGGTNGGMVTTHTVAVIEDISTSADSCDVDDPGSDIMAVALEDDTGTVLGWAEVAGDGIVFDGNMFTGTAQINGDAPGLSAGQCVDDFNSDTVTALGCGGWLGVRFLDADDNPIPLDATAGQVIRVYEYGGQCSTGSVTDEYSVYICTDPNGVAGGAITSCNITVLQGGSAETSGDVTGF